MAIAYSDDQRVGSIATYSCTAAGNVPSGGDATRTCSADGSWDGAAPTSCIVRRSPPRTQKCLGICVPNGNRRLGIFWRILEFGFCDGKTPLLLRLKLPLLLRCFCACLSLHCTLLMTGEGRFEW